MAGRLPGHFLLAPLKRFQFAGVVGAEDSHLRRMRALEIAQPVLIGAPRRNPHAGSAAV
jgi:hypothetical protein